jgi:hypothetical protein
MKKIVFFLLLGCNYLMAQQSVNASGGNSTGSGGSFSYSVGQIDYVSVIGSNGSLSQGVQQAFEIFTLGTDNFPTITLQVIVYPNPTVNNLTLKIDNYSSENLLILLYDVFGKVIFQQKITQNETAITMENLQAANYFLHVSDKGKSIKTFKIIKN